MLAATSATTITALIASVSVSLAAGAAAVSVSIGIAIARDYIGTNPYGRRPRTTRSPPSPRR